MNKEDQNPTPTTPTTEPTPEPGETFTVQENAGDDLQVEAFERGPLTDLNFGF